MKLFGKNAPHSQAKKKNALATKKRLTSRAEHLETLTLFFSWIRGPVAWQKKIIKRH
jgi:hypothetical protein